MPRSASSWPPQFTYGIVLQDLRCQWEVVDSDAASSDEYTEAELSAIRETMKVAILYTCAYLFEHREEADHHALTMTLRSLLFAIREGEFS